ncbi:MAG TPA: hypothetical protein VKV27_00220 [Solirubrobacteraceae bacterium]|nr:hypothetical protein [Solirubrobacteraceae bacterium]
MTVRRLARTIGDGFRCESAPGLRSVADAERLADEIAFSASRLALLEHDPPGLYAEVAAEGDLEERSWLCFLVAYLGPLEHDAPFAEIQRVRVPWRAAGELRLERPRLGPRTAHDPARASRTIDAYRAWAARSGSQAAAYTGEPGWSAERRFERVFERLALPGLHRAARFELLCSLGRLGVYELRAGTLALGGEDPVTLAAKRVLGIGDRLLLERRAAELARSCGVGLDALDLALFNWERGERARVGVDGDLPVDPGILAGVRAALELD